MNPNQPNHYQPYQGSYKPNQFNTNQFNNQQQFNQNTLNIPQVHNFTHGGSLSPSQNNHLTRPKLDRAMYSSTIQSLAPSKNFTFGKLESMGRFVGGVSQQQRMDNNKFGLDNNYQHNQQNSYNYQQNHQQKMKPNQKFNLPNHANDFDRFPAFNLQDKSHMHTNNINNNYTNHTENSNHQEQKSVIPNQTPQQKRRRQILAIKQQLEMINKKMQSANLNKKVNVQLQKNDMKFNINQPSNSGQNNNYLNVNNSNFNNNFNNNVSINNNFGTNNQQSSFTGGLQFNKSNHLSTGYERNRGLATQSMIVSNQPSSNFKYQSIFDKYESLKKPTYETTQAPKQERPLLLDKFVNKGPGFNSFNTNTVNKDAQSSQKTSFDYKSNNFGLSTNNANMNTHTSTSNFENSNLSLNNNYTSSNTSNSHNSNLYTGGNINNTNNLYSNINNNNNVYSNSNANSNNFIQKNNEYTNNLGSNYSKSTTTSYNSGLSSNDSHQGSKQSIGTGVGMFKKKKENPYLEQVKHQYTLPTSPRNNQQENNVFKKAKTPLYQDNIVTNAMKKMNIQQSVQFKRQDFNVGKKLGKGQFGQVMLVQHKKTGFLCGMKVMEKKQIRQQKYQGQITRQLSIQFYLAHRNITPLYGYFQDQKNVYLLIEYCTGGQLLQMLRKNRRMQEPQVSRVIRQIIQGIDYIHKQLIIHRDIKPQNILFNFGVAKICDFGWAVYKGHGMRKTASVGSPLYYSPEIVMGVQYDEKIDIWDIGMMTYECLLGKIPFRIYSQLDLNRIVQDEIKFPQYIDTSEQAKDFILRIMKKKPQQRMQIRQMLRHPFITKYPDPKLPVQIMKDFKQVLSN